MRQLVEHLPKLSDYTKGNVPARATISSRLVQFNRLVKAMINQLFTLPHFIALGEKGMGEGVWGGAARVGSLQHCDKAAHLCSKKTHFHPS